MKTIKKLVVILDDAMAKRVRDHGFSVDAVLAFVSDYTGEISPVCADTGDMDFGCTNGNDLLLFAPVAKKQNAFLAEFQNADDFICAVRRNYPVAQIFSDDELKSRIFWLDGYTRETYRNI